MAFLSNLFSSWNPVVSFPPYHGPYDVGTVDVEIPTSELPAPAQAPEGAAPTVAFRIFYPCQKPASSQSDRPVRWIPQPQRATIRAFAHFLGMQSPRLANLVSFLPQQLYYITIPAHRNAKILDARTSNGRWPVAFFSHGLAGSRNAYSYVCGDLASNGTIVVALDHRDGSSPIQYVRATAETEAHIVDPVKISHSPSPEVYEARDKQLRIRLWEMSLAYEALMKIDAGQAVGNLDINSGKKQNERVEVLWQFDSMLDIHRAGKVTWSGHSFGAATTVQLLKSIYYRKERPDSANKPLITPNADAAIVHQIMPESPALLLDTWGLPMKSHDQEWLWDRPLPSYAVGGPAGSNVVSILSEAFFNWQDNTNIIIHIVAAPSPSRQPSAAPRLTRERGRLLPDWAHLRDVSPSRDSGYQSTSNRSPRGSLSRQHSHASGTSTPSRTTSSQGERDSAAIASAASPRALSPTRNKGPHMFYVQKSQHFNQSDFGLLFPWVAKKMTKAEDPERIMELNNRAMVQTLREAGIEVAGEQDHEILNKDGEIWRWRHIPIEDDSDVNNEQAFKAVTRKLSIASSGKSIASARESMTMGQKTEAELD